MKQMTSTFKSYRAFASNIGFAGETGFAGRLVLQKNWFCRETGFLTLGKLFIIMLVVKQITYNAKVSDNTIL